MDKIKSNKKKNINSATDKIPRKTNNINQKKITNISNENTKIFKIITEIKDVIDSIRFYINQDGGDLEFVEYNDKKGEVVIKLLGACVGCGLIDLTYKDGLETILKQEVKEVKFVKLIE